MNFAQVLAIYQAGDTAEAVKIWRQEVHQSAWTGEEKRLAYQYLLQIYPPHTPEHIQWRWELACCLEELKLWPKALELFYLDESLDRIGTNLHHIWHCQMCLGQVAEASATATKLLAYYLRTKKLMLGLAFLDELATTNFSSREHFSFQIKFWILQGNLAAIAKVIKKIKYPAEVINDLSNISAEPILLDTKLAVFWPQLEAQLGSLQTTHLKAVTNANATASHSLTATIVQLHKLGQAASARAGKNPQAASKSTLAPRVLQEVLHLCREFLKTSYLKILFYPEQYNLWPDLIRYAQLLARPKLLSALKNLITQHPVGDAKLQSAMEQQLAQVADEALPLAKELTPAETMVGPCDMATDLFLQELTIADLKAARIKRMERDIAFLQRQGEKAKAAAILKTLQEIDADNTMAYQAAPAAGKRPEKLSPAKTPEDILAYLDRRVDFFASSPLMAQEAKAGEQKNRAEDHVAGDDVSADLNKGTGTADQAMADLANGLAEERSATVYTLRPLGSRRRNDLVAEYHFQERYFLLYLKYLEPEEVLPIYRDLIYAWRSLGMARPGLALLEKIQQWREEQKQKNPSVFVTQDDLRLMAVQIQDIYLQAILLGDIGDYYPAIDLLEGQIKFAPLQKDEMVCFCYLLGEYYTALGRFKEARQLFQRVYHLNKHYRLVQLRMKELEA